MGDLEFHFLHQSSEVIGTFLGSAKAVSHPKKNRAVRQGIKYRRPVLVQIDDSLPRRTERVRSLHVFTQLINIKLSASNLLTGCDQLFDLGDYILSIVGKVQRILLLQFGTIACAGNVYCHYRNLMYALPDFRPFDIGITGVGQYGDSWLGNSPHWMLATTELY